MNQQTIPTWDELDKSSKKQWAIFCSAKNLTALNFLGDGNLGDYQQTCWVSLLSKKSNETFRKNKDKIASFEISRDSCEMEVNALLKLMNFLDQASTSMDFDIKESLQKEVREKVNSKASWRKVFRLVDQLEHGELKF